MDKIKKLKEAFPQWTNSKIQTGMNVSDWWEIERNLELSKEKLSEFNVLEIRQISISGIKLHVTKSS